MFIKSVSADCKDVFLGRGWENWVRYERDASGKWHATKGLRPDKTINDKIVHKLTTWQQR